MRLFSKSTPSKLTVTAFIASCVLAQTYTTCNPLQQSCEPAPALGGSLTTNFLSGQSNRYEAYLTSDKVTYTDKGATFTLAQRGDSPTVESDFFIMFGRIQFTAQSAPGVGIVSSMVLLSEDLDEIDIEWVGGDNAQVQTNYFSKGDTSVYNRGQYHPVPNPNGQFNTYAIDWTQDRINWEINGQVVRTLTNPGTGYYPQSPMQVRFGSWAGGDPSNSQGTIEWAGGPTDYNAGPYIFYVQDLAVTDYSTGTEYAYGDHSGSWTSIQAIDGTINGNVNGEHAANAAAPASSGASSAEPVSSSSSSISSAQTPATSSFEPSPPASSSVGSTFTYVASSSSVLPIVSQEEPSSTSLVPVITTVTPADGESAYIITSSWDADSSVSTDGAMTFEFSQGSDTNEKVRKPEETEKPEYMRALSFIYKAETNATEGNATESSAATSAAAATTTAAQANGSTMKSPMSVAMLMGSAFIAYTVLL